MPSLTQKPTTVKTAAPEIQQAKGSESYLIRTTAHLFFLLEKGRKVGITRLVESDVRVISSESDIT